MTPERFVAVNRELFGKKQSVWRKRFTELTGFNASVITRYVNGEVPIPLTVANLLLALENLVWYKDDIFDTFELGDQQA